MMSELNPGCMAVELKSPNTYTALPLPKNDPLCFLAQNPSSRRFVLATLGVELRILTILDKAAPLCYSPSTPSSFEESREKNEPFHLEGTHDRKA